MDELSKKTQSGIPGLDDLIGGGFRKNSIISVSGSTGSGRTIFGLQFLMGGIEQGEVGMYISFDEKKHSFYENMKSCGWNLAAMEAKKQFVFIEYPVHEVESLIDQESGIRDLIDAVGVERVVLDSVTPFALSFDSEDDRRIALGKLVEKMRKWLCTVLVIAEDTGEHGIAVPRTKAGIEYVADGFIHLSFIKDGMKRSRYLEVVKMRGAAHMHEMFPAKIDDEGFSVITGKVQVRKKEKLKQAVEEKQQVKKEIMPEQRPKLSKFVLPKSFDYGKEETELIEEEEKDDII